MLSMTNVQLAQYRHVTHRQVDESKRLTVKIILAKQLRGDGL